MVGGLEHLYPTLLIYFVLDIGKDGGGDGRVDVGYFDLLASNFLCNFNFSVLSNVCRSLRDDITIPLAHLTRHRHWTLASFDV